MIAQFPKELAKPIASTAPEVMAWYSDSALLKETVFCVLDHVSKGHPPDSIMPPDVLLLSAPWPLQSASPNGSTLLGRR